MFTGRDLDDGCHAGSWPGGQADPGQFDPEYGHGLTFDSDPLKINSIAPGLQLADQLDADLFGDPLFSEQIRNVDDTQAANLHVVPNPLWRGSPRPSVRINPQVHYVIGDESVAARNQLERALAFANTAGPLKQHTNGVHLDQCTMDRHARPPRGANDP